MMATIGKNILTGLFTMLPVVLTLYLLYWLVVSTEKLLGGVLHYIVPDVLYVPGMGVGAGLVVAFSVGLLMHSLLVQRLFARGESIFYRLPLVKSVYMGIRDLLDYFSPKRKKDFEQVVAVTLGETGLQLIGLVTRTDLDDVPGGLNVPDTVLVYFPMSYMIGGYAALTPRSAIRPLNMKMEEAMRFILTAGVTGSPVQSHGNENPHP
ncbi:MAG: DUF502 domain-containing protein [Gammaproteobacteria bacterium]|jgi:uncharacterized membrane protein|nr:DUF502 domain-containing protein [Gammaproteobacteria bacterium]